MPGDVDLCNAALLLLGEAEITNLDEATPAAQACRRLYPPTRDALLRSEPWRFARVRTTLARLELTPASSYRYYYGLPTTPPVLRIEALEPPHYSYARELITPYGGPQEVIATSAPEVTILYTGRVAEGYFDGLFAEALTHALAFKLCAALTGKPDLVKVLAEQAKYWQEMAIVANRTEDSALTPPTPAPDHRYFAVTDQALAADVQICNEALLIVQQPPISAFTEGTPAAHACAVLYPQVRDTYLRMAPWRFARLRTALTALTEKPASTYSTYYALPTDPPVLRIEDIQCGQAPYSREMVLSSGQWVDALATNATSAILLYTAAVEAARFAPGFRQAVVYALAVRLAPLFGAETAKRVPLWEEQARLALEAAKADNSHEDTPRHMARNTQYLDVRGSYSYDRGDPFYQVTP